MHKPLPMGSAEKLQKQFWICDPDSDPDYLCGGLSHGKSPPYVKIAPGSDE